MLLCNKIGGFIVYIGMARGNVLQPVFKTYSQQQAYLLPPSLEEMIAANHPVRVVNEVLNKIDIQPLMRQYKTGGSSIAVAS
jgi:hypothetical protein